MIKILDKNYRWFECDETFWTKGMKNGELVKVEVSEGSLWKLNGIVEKGFYLVDCFGVEIGVYLDTCRKYFTEILGEE